ncbi:SDR family oxidoreductase [Sphingomonas endolithica]|uniref:SDR family oxidoreductase n=1 Tax=Sphingomonas endolithica TaxID=2972485 RepID=UPI0021AF6EE2|nr:SDR family oxidoreductase [Sphingomonas sp. ZFBP2030]
MKGEQQRAAIVTGASHGIGAAVAERLAQDGFAVVVNYSSGSDQADALVAQIEAVGGKAIAVKADVSDPAAVRAVFDAAEEAFGGVDVLVNNAGVMRLTPIAEADDDAFDTTIAVNLKGAFNGLREGARRLRDGGRIVSFSSSVVGLYQPTYALYAATKAGIEAMTHIVAKELGGRRITVNAVAPGPVDTALFTKGKEQAQIDAIKKMNPLGRLGEPEDIARVVSFLAGPDGGWINGQVLRANGGVI